MKRYFEMNGRNYELKYVRHDIMSMEVFPVQDIEDATYIGVYQQHEDGRWLNQFDIAVFDGGPTLAEVEMKLKAIAR